jgi:hypothetical protein
MTSRNGYYKTAYELYNYQNKSELPKNNKEAPRIPPSVNLNWKTSNYKNTEDPAVWGPSFWFSLHNGAAKYPVNASKIVAQKMKGFILGIPYILPCTNCSEHAKAHIEKNYKKLDYICSGRTQLFDFFCKFHNYVNKRYGKPELTTEDAWKIYSGGASVAKLSYSSV